MLEVKVAEDLKPEDAVQIFTSEGKRLVGKVKYNFRESSGKHSIDITELTEYYSSGMSCGAYTESVKYRDVVLTVNPKDLYVWDGNNLIVFGNSFIRFVEKVLKYKSRLIANEFARVFDNLLMLNENA